MGKHLYILFVGLIGLISCSDKICPAFQSYYVLDDAKRDNLFSLVRNDSLPREFLDYMPAEPKDVKKSKYGIVKQPPVLSYILKENEMMTIEMDHVWPTTSDVDTLGSEEGGFMEGEVPGDSVVIQKLGPGQYGLQNKDAGYNADQEIYEEIFADYLIAAEKEANAPEEEEVDEEDLAEGEEGVDGEEEPKKKGFFKGFGKKKKKKKEDSEVEEDLPDDDPVDRETEAGGGE